MKISENTSVSMPVKNMLMIIAGVVAGVFAYTELTSRLVSLETSRELFENDLLKKSEQVPVDQEQHFLLEDLYKSVEKMVRHINDRVDCSITYDCTRRDQRSPYTTNNVRLFERKARCKTCI